MSACTTGWLVRAAAAAMGAEPRPDSLENRPGHAQTDGHHHRGTGKAAGGRHRLEGAGHDHGQDAGDLGDVHEDDSQRAQHVEGDHDGHQQGGHAADAAHTADDDGGGQAHEHDTGDAGSDGKAVVEGVSHGIGLHHAADAEGGDGREEGEQGRQPFPAQPARDVVHGAAAEGAVLVLHAVFHGQHGFGVFGGHAHEAGHPHPEQGTGAADVDGRGHTGDIAGAHGGRKGHHQSLEVGDVALGLPVGGLADDEGECVDQMTELQGSQGKGQPQARADQKDHQWPSPDIPRNHVQEIQHVPSRKRGRSRVPPGVFALN